MQCFPKLWAFMTIFTNPTNVLAQFFSLNLFYSYL